MVWPNPKNKMISNSTPLLIFSSTAAKVKIDPRMGPIQGVQPKPKAAPTNKWKM